MKLVIKAKASEVTKRANKGDIKPKDGKVVNKDIKHKAFIIVVGLFMVSY
jgi:hypothetical protein